MSVDAAAFIYSIIFQKILTNKQKNYFIMATKIKRNPKGFPAMNFQLTSTEVVENSGQNNSGSSLYLSSLRDKECEVKGYFLHCDNPQKANSGVIKIKIGERILIWNGTAKTWSSSRIEDLEVVHPEMLEGKYTSNSRYSTYPDVKCTEVEKIHFDTLQPCSSVYTPKEGRKPEEFWKDCIKSEDVDAIYKKLSETYEERCRLSNVSTLIKDIRDNYESLTLKRTRVCDYNYEFSTLMNRFFTKREINGFNTEDSDIFGIYEEYDPIDDPDYYREEFIVAFIKELGGLDNIKKHINKLTDELNAIKRRISRCTINYEILLRNVEIPTLNRSTYLKACGVKTIVHEYYLLQEDNSILEPWTLQSEGAILVNPGVNDTCTSWMPNHEINIIVDTYGNVYKYEPMSLAVTCYVNNVEVEFEGPYIGSKKSFRSGSEKILEKGNVKALRLGYIDYARMLGCSHIAKTSHNDYGNEIFTIDTY